MEWNMKNVMCTFNISTVLIHNVELRSLHWYTVSQHHHNKDQVLVFDMIVIHAIQRYDH